MSQAPDVSPKRPIEFRVYGGIVWNFIGMLIVFVAGVLLHASLGFQRYQGEMTVVLVMAATLCLGFGIGVLVCWRYRGSDEDALREKYTSLHHRAALLVEMADKLERKKELR